MSISFHITAQNPPFFGKNEWILDPSKIVQKTAKQTLSTIPKEEKEDENSITETSIESPIRRVVFAPYVTVYSSSKMIHTEPLKHKRDNTRARLQSMVELLDDEVFIMRYRRKQLLRKLTALEETSRDLRSSQWKTTMVVLIAMLLVTLAWIHGKI